MEIRKELIESIERVELSEVYDIEVEDVHCYFLKPDILVHNSSKTWSLLQWIIYYCTENTGKRITIMRAKLTWLRASIMVDFIKILMDNDLYDLKDHNKTQSIYNLFGNQIWFIGLDETQKLHGLTQDVAYINEAIEANQRDFRQIAQRTSEVILMDYNPSYTEHWIYDSVIPRQDCDWFKSTMLDNPFLDESLINEIKSYEPTPENIKQGTADEFHWKVYGLGERAQAEGLIYKNWEINDTLPDPHTVKWTGIGVDFGYTNDPTAGIMVSYSQGEMYLRELFYRTHMSTSDIYQSLRSFQSEIVGDSAEPRLIEELQAKGLNIRGAIKGKDSILPGIDKVKQYKLIVTSSSMNLIKELRNYKWSEDVSGKQTNKPIDNFNHCFKGNTKILTIEGEKNISNISTKDLVLTRLGFNKVLKVFNNGISPVSKYWLLFGTRLVILECTNKHLIETDKGWTKISELKKGMRIYHTKSLTVRDTIYTQMKDISQEALTGFIELFGSFIMALFQKDTRFTIKTAISKITTLKILISLMANYTKNLSLKKGSRKILSTLRSFRKWGLKPLRTGTNPKRVEGGIVNTQGEYNLATEHTASTSAIIAQRSLLKNHHMQGSVVTLANQIIEGSKAQTTNKESASRAANRSPQINMQKLDFVHESVQDKCAVFDIMVESNHEYFANGVLVHNSLDAVRYIIDYKTKYQDFYVV